jgi:hypothetical protein
MSLAVNKPVGNGVFLAFLRLRQMPRVRIALERPSQAPVVGPAAIRRGCRFLPKPKKSDWVLRQPTESWANSDRSTHSPGRKTSI